MICYSDLWGTTTVLDVLVFESFTTCISVYLSHFAAPFPVEVSDGTSIDVERVSTNFF